MEIKALIIDDEERARDTLSSLLGTYCPEVRILDKCSNVPEGVISIQKNKPQLVFLDVEMPVYNGFELINFFNEVDFEIIFITAYSQHAIKAFEVSAVDYILKPIDIDKLISSIEKFKTKNYFNDMKLRLDTLNENIKSENIKRIALPMSDGSLFVEVDEIVMLEADGSYTDVHLKSGAKILISKKLKFFEDLIDRPYFFRSHRSYFININHINKYMKGEGEILMENNLKASISRDKKIAFEDLLKSLKLSI